MTAEGMMEGEAIMSEATNRIGFGPRAGAVLIDMGLSFIGGTLIAILFGGVLGAGASSLAGPGAGSDSVDLAAIFGFIAGGTIGMTVFGVLYNLIEAFTGASPGKRVLGLVVGSAEGTAATQGTLMARYAVKNAQLLIALLAIVAPILAPLSPLAGLVVFGGCFAALGVGRQALHDMIVKTAVYARRDLASA
ncbi:MAG TPA: RDD family protein [Myxococcota bacterium]|nr:RDD family protein [Myxococcota bacterium]